MSPNARPASATLPSSSRVEVDRADAGRRGWWTPRPRTIEVTDDETRRAPGRARRSAGDRPPGPRARTRTRRSARRTRRRTRRRSRRCSMIRRSVPAEAEQRERAVGEAPRHLHRGALPAGRAAEEVGDRGADEDQRRHAPRHPGGGLVDLVEDQVVAPDRVAGAVVVAEADGEAGDGQQPQQPGVLDAEVGDPVEGRQERGGGQPGEHPDQGARATHFTRWENRSMLAGGRPARRGRRASPLAWAASVVGRNIAGLPPTRHGAGCCVGAISRAGGFGEPHRLRRAYRRPACASVATHLGPAARAATLKVRPAAADNHGARPRWRADPRNTRRR